MERPEESPFAGKETDASPDWPKLQPVLLLWSLQILVFLKIFILNDNENLLGSSDERNKLSSLTKQTAGS